MQLFDAGMIAFAAWHALKGRVDWPLTYQVPRMLRARLRETPDTYVLCWNARRLRKRERWPPYRDRPEIWEEAGEQDFETMLRLLAGLGAVQYRADGWEADEVLAALVHRLEGQEELVVRSDDKDFMQILSGSTWMRGRVRGEVRFSDVREILGVTPAYVADFLALAGDEADGIPRIVPPATARELIESRGHVRDWIDRDLRVEEDLKRTLRDNREQLRLNLELVDLSRERVGEPPPPLLDGWGDADAVREVGRTTGIGELTEEDLDEAFGRMRELGRTTRDRLGV